MCVPKRTPIVGIFGFTSSLREPAEVTVVEGVLLPFNLVTQDEGVSQDDEVGDRGVRDGTSNDGGGGG